MAVSKTLASYELMETGDRRAIGPLIAVLDHEHEWVRKNARKGLESITGKRFKDTSEWQQWWE